MVLFVEKVIQKIYDCHELTSESFSKCTVLFPESVVGFRHSPFVFILENPRCTWLPGMRVVSKSLHQSEPSEILIIVGPDA